MAQGNLTVTANTSGGPDGARSFGPLTVTANAAITQTLTITLAVGANTVNLPAGTTCLLIQPPNSVYPAPSPAYGGVVTLKGLSADTGIAISNKWVTLLSFDAVSEPASIVLAATAVGTVTVWLM